MTDDSTFDWFGIMGDAWVRNPLACRICPFLHPEGSLSLKEVAEYERLDWHLYDRRHTPREALRYAMLFQRRYFPPCDLERMGAA